MKKYKPILFSTPMVQAILEGRKTQTRRIVKKKYSNTDLEFRTDKYGTALVEIQNDVPPPTKMPDGRTQRRLRFFEHSKPKYQVGDILWVREAWDYYETSEECIDENTIEYRIAFAYKALNTLPKINDIQWAKVSEDKYWKAQEKIDYEENHNSSGWKLSIHMPREAARIFLEVVSAYVFSHGGAPVYVFYADSESINFRKAMLDAGYKISSTLVWVKNSFVLGRLDYHMQHEPIIFCEETQPTEIETHRNLIYGWNAEAAHPWHSDRKQSSVLRFDKPTRNADHPTMKPLDLISYLVKNSSKQREIVADGFLGSGSTLIASEMNWRECRGFELDPRFADVIVRRWVTYMRENKLKYEVYRNGKLLSDTDLQKFENKNQE